MGIFKRIKDISSAAIHDMIDKAEDPVKMLNQYLRDMVDDIAQAEVAVARQIAIEKRFKHQLEEAEEMVDKRRNQAMAALQAGNEELTRKALMDKKHHMVMVEEYKIHHENAKMNADQLRAQLTEMVVELDKMKYKKTQLVARAETARAQKNMNQTMSGFGQETGVKGFERMKDKVMQLEAEAEASQELNASSRRTLDQELNALVKDDVDDELALLKAEMMEKKEEK